MGAQKINTGKKKFNFFAVGPVQILEELRSMVDFDVKFFPFLFIEENVDEE